MSLFEGISIKSKKNLQASEKNSDLTISPSKTDSIVSQNNYEDNNKDSKLLSSQNQPKSKHFSFINTSNILIQEPTINSEPCQGSSTQLGLKKVEASQNLDFCTQHDVEVSSMSSLSFTIDEPYRPPNLEVSDFSISPHTYPSLTNSEVVGSNSNFTEHSAPFLPIVQNEQLEPVKESTSNFSLLQPISGQSLNLKNFNDDNNIKLSSNLNKAWHSSDTKNNLESLPDQHEYQENKGTTQTQNSIINEFGNEIEVVSQRKGAFESSADILSVEAELLALEENQNSYFNHLNNEYGVLNSEYFELVKSVKDFPKLENSFISKLFKLEEIQDAFVQSEDYLNAELVNSEIKQTKDEFSEHKKKFTSNLLNQLDLYPRFQNVIENYLKNCISISSRAQSIENSYGSEIALKIQEKTTQLGSERSKLLVEKESNALNISSINEEKDRLSREAEKVNNIIKTQTSAYRAEIEESETEARKIALEIASLEDKLLQKKREHNTLLHTIHSNELKIASVRAKYEKQLTRIEKAENLLQQSIEDLSEDETQINKIEENIQHIEVELTQLNSHYSLRNSDLLKFLKKSLKHSEMAQSFKDIRMLLNGHLEDWTKGLIDTRLKLENNHQKIQTKLDQIEQFEALKDSTRDVIKSLEVRLSEKLLEKKSAISSRSYKDATNINTEMKELEFELKQAQSQVEAVHKSLIDEHQTLKEFEAEEIKLVNRCKSETLELNQKLSENLLCVKSKIKLLESEMLHESEPLITMIQKELENLEILNLIQAPTLDSCNEELNFKEMSTNEKLHNNNTEVDRNNTETLSDTNENFHREHNHEQSHNWNISQSADECLSENSQSHYEKGLSVSKLYTPLDGTYTESSDNNYNEPSEDHNLETLEDLNIKLSQDCISKSSDGHRIENFEDPNNGDIFDDTSSESLDHLHKNTSQLETFQHISAITTQTLDNNFDQSSKIIKDV